MYYSAERECTLLGCRPRYYHFPIDAATGLPNDYYEPWDDTTLTATWDDDSVDELYAHAGDDSTDLDRWENTNLALDPAYAHVTARLRAKLQAHFAASA